MVKMCRDGEESAEGTHYAGGYGREIGVDRVLARPPVCLSLSACVYARRGMTRMAESVPRLSGTLATGREGGTRGRVGRGEEMGLAFSRESGRGGCRGGGGAAVMMVVVARGCAARGEDQSTGDDFITTRHSSTTLKYQKSGGRTQVRQPAARARRDATRTRGSSPHNALPFLSKGDLGETEQGTRCYPRVRER